MMLKYTNVRSVDLGVWDQLVEETYGRTYRFQQQDGCKSRGTESFSVPLKYDVADYEYENVTVPEEINGEEMGVSFKAWLERDPKQKVMDGTYDGTILFWERNFYPSLDVVANDLYSKGLIEEGTYTIDIDW
jgi:hypothetical protein